MNQGEIWLVEKIGEIAPDEINKVQEGIIKILGI